MALGSINRLTIGLNPDEVQNFLKNEIKTGIIEEAKNELKGQKYNAFINEIQSNWAGQAKSNFIENLNTSLDSMSAHFDKEYENIYFNFATLVENFKDEDENLIGKF